MGFWKNYKNLIKDVVLDYQYLVMLDEADIEIEREREDASLPGERSQAITNFKIAAGLMDGEHYGWWFQDTDVYKWIETAAYILEQYEDVELKQKVDDVIDIIEKAQDESGYLTTFYQLKHPDLIYKQLDRSHELYNAGHLIEAAVAYFKSTGEDKLLNVAERYIDHIIEHFGPGKIEGADGHQEIELALIKLYELTQDKKYLDLSDYFISVRGENPEFYNDQKRALGEEPFTNLDYLQAYTQPKFQTEARGHAVRMLYMMEAMADLAHYNQDCELEKAVTTLWNDIVDSKMYVTGGVGQTVHGEAFSDSYELPNDTMYCETCAAIGMMNTAKKMFRLHPNNEYIEVLERSLYNSALAGMAQDGQHFFYVNPLEYIKDRYRPDKGHVKGERPEWLGCACCPPNLTRTIASIDSYFYTRLCDDFYIHMYADSNYEDETVIVHQLSNFPKDINNKFEIEVKSDNMKFHFRKPSWVSDFKLYLDGEPLEGLDVELSKGKYIIKLVVEFIPFAVYSNPLVTQNANKVSFQFGPFVYCAESVDQVKRVFEYKVNPKEIDFKWIEDDLAQRYNLYVSSKILRDNNKNLYSVNPFSFSGSEDLTLIPYYLWANRGETDMMVWLNLDCGGNDDL